MGNILRVKSAHTAGACLLTNKVYKRHKNKERETHKKKRKSVTGGAKGRI
jgi:hypothetical protein